jgi:RHS repeat-associated protein
MTRDQDYPGINRRQAGSLLTINWFAALLLIAYFSPILIDPVYADASPFPSTTYYKTQKDACFAWGTASPVISVGPYPGTFIGPGYGIIDPSVNCVNAFMGWGYVRNYWWCGGGSCLFGAGLATGTGVAFVDVNFDIVTCASGLDVLDPTSPQCKPPKRECCDGKGGDCVGNPADACNGNKFQSERDYQNNDGSLSFTRIYSSILWDKDIGLGFGWSSSFHAYLQILNATTLFVFRANGTGEQFVKDTIGVWQGDADTQLMVTQDASGYVLTSQKGDTDRYDIQGRLASHTDPSGKTTSYSYDGNGRLSQVTGPFGHSLSFSYDTYGRLDHFTDPAGRLITYTYNNGDLMRATYPDGSSRIYHYENLTFPHRLTGISEDNGAGTVSRYATYTYDDFGKVSNTQHAITDNASPQESFVIRYDAVNQATVTDALGNQEQLTFETRLGTKMLVKKLALADNKVLTQSFDANTNLISKTNEEGRVTNYTYNATNQKLSQTEAVGTPEERTTSYQYLSPTLSLPTLIQSPSVFIAHQKQTSTIYQNNNPVTITQSGYRPDGAPISRTVSMQYNSAGQVTQIDGPRTDVLDITTLDYYPCALGNECGQLKSVTNALGQLTTYDTYNADGRITQITDPNGVVSQYTYDTRGRVATLTQTPPGAAPRTTSYLYDSSGQPIQTQMPNGVTLTYSYDAAHYLRSVSDNAGNKVEYRYDAKGNRTQETSKDPDGTVVRAVTTSYDARNRVTAINAGGSLTQQIHDALGNLITQTDPNNATAGSPVNTNYSYDALNRLIQTFDRLGSPVAYSYDVNDKITQIIPSNGISTRYAYDDLGNLLQEQSPTRGTTTYIHNDAGQVLSRTDADGIMVAYAYDALGRLTQMDYPGVDDDISYVFDSAPGCTNGIGRLCMVTDASGITRYAYDGFGNMTQETKTELGVTYTIQYAYDAANQLTAITYPDGRTITYTRNLAGRVTDVTLANNGITTNLLSAITTRADGLIKSQTFGNGLTETRTYDLQGRLTNQNVGSETRSYTYDTNGNLITIPSTTYGYDLIDRLVQAALGTESTSYLYEGNGDLLYKTSSSPNPPPRDDVFTYDAPGHLTQYKKGGVVKGSYVYDYHNLRTRKSSASGIAVYHYDQHGNLIAETRTDGTLIRTYLWFNNTPVVQIDRNGTAEIFTYLHTDHLATPRFATSAQGTKVWSWNNEGFGNSLANEDPDNDGILTTINLRFPGQYFDQESGLHYNWNRYYDPRTGRYITSDPIGLRGGLNTYAYTRDNPLRLADPTGLITWTGSMGGFSIVEGGGGGFVRFSLTSECVNGQKATVKVLASAIGVGVGARITFSGSSVTLTDKLSYIDPYVFNGWFAFDSIGMGFGDVTSFSKLWLGGAESPAEISQSIGYDFSITSLTGASFVYGTPVFEECCKLK